MIVFFEFVYMQYYLDVMFYVVVMLIGNMVDIMLCVLYVFGFVDCIVVEDICNMGQLFVCYGILKLFVVVYEYNECEVVQCVIELLCGGECVVYVLDVGMLGILDFGVWFVDVVCVVGFVVVLLFGVSVVVIVFSVVGDWVGVFMFVGFLLLKVKQCVSVLQVLVLYLYVLVFYEVLYWIVEIVVVFVDVFGFVCWLLIVCEFIKLYEQLFQGILVEGQGWFVGDVNWQCGEFVLVVEGVLVVSGEVDDVVYDVLFRLLFEEVLVKSVVKFVAVLMGVLCNVLYVCVFVLKEGMEG